MYATWLAEELHLARNPNTLILSDTEEHITQDGLDSSASTLVPKDIPVLCTRMAVGRCALTTRPTAINQDLKALLVNDEFDLRFFIRLLRYRAPGLVRLSIGTTVRGIRTSDLLALPIIYANKPEQSRIAAVLNTVDEAIAKTEAVIAKLRQVRAGLLHDLLTRGFDAHGELRDPFAHPEQFQDSPVGRIPRAWRVSLARDLCSTITKGTTPPADAFSTASRSVRYLRVDNLTFTGDLDLSPAPLFVNRATHEGLLGRSIVLEGDVLMNIVGPPLGKVSVVPASDHEWNVNQAIAIFRVASEISPYYLSRWLLTSSVQTWFWREAKRTSGQVNLTLEMCGNLPVPVPEASEEARIVELLRAIDTHHAFEDACLSKLRALKSGLTVDLLTGLVRVSKTIDFVNTAHSPAHHG